MALAAEVEIAKATHWAIVHSCLVELHGWQEIEAEQAIADLRRRLATLSALAQELAYHEEPFNVAGDLARNTLNYDSYKHAYDAIRVRHVDQSLAANPELFTDLPRRHASGARW